MAVQIVQGTLANGGAVFETAGGTKVALFLNSSAQLVAYKDIDGTPSLIGSAQTATTVHGGGAIDWIHAAIDSSDIVHVVSSCSADQTRDVAYNTISDPDGTPAWGTWEEAASYTDAAPIDPSCYITIDSNDKPHVAFMDRVTLKGATEDNAYYIEKTGASWGGLQQLGERGTKTYNYHSPAITMTDATNDYIRVVYNTFTGLGTTGIGYRTYTTSWSAEIRYTIDGDNVQNVRPTATSSTTYDYHAEANSGTKDLHENNVDVGYDTKTLSIVAGVAPHISSALAGTDRYLFYIDSGDDVHLISNDGGGWTDEGDLKTGTYEAVIAGWQFNNLNNTTSIDYLYDDGTYVYWEEYSVSGTAYNQSAAGTLTSSGTVDTLPKKALAGTLTSSGTLAKKAYEALAGTLTSTGELAKKSYWALAGTLTSSGVVSTTSVFARTYAGTLTSSGVVTTLATFRETVEGTLTFTGDVAKKSYWAIAGTLTFTGDVAKKSYWAIAGTLTSSGTVDGSKIAGGGSTTPIPDNFWKLKQVRLSQRRR